MDSHSVDPNNPYLAPATNVADIIVPGKIELAKRFVRLGAFTINSLVFIILFYVLIFILSFSFMFFNISDTNSGFSYGGIAYMWTLSSILAFIGAFILFIAINFQLLRDNGQTFGKHIFKIKIVNNDGSSINVWWIIFFRYFLQWIFFLIPIIGFIYISINYLLIFRKSHKCLHDNIANTIVVKI